MSYATLPDLVLAFGEQSIIDLTDRADPPAGAVDAEVAARALADAVGEMEGYLGVRYSLPVTAQPERLRAVCCDLARYRLCGDRVTDEVRVRYEDAVRWLKDISAGRAILAGALPPAGGAPAATLVQVAPGRKVFKGGVL